MSIPAAWPQVLDFFGTPGPHRTVAWQVSIPATPPPVLVSYPQSLAGATATREHEPLRLPGAETSRVGSRVEHRRAWHAFSVAP
jgi:hypothetical protein